MLPMKLQMFALKHSVLDLFTIIMQLYCNTVKLKKKHHFVQCDATDLICAAFCDENLCVYRVIMCGMMKLY